MNNKFAILADSTCDLPASLAEELDIDILPMTVLIDGREYLNYLDGREIGFHEFYEMTRAGKQTTTAAVNSIRFREAMEPFLKAGRDVLYIGFSSGLSSTYNVSVAVAKELSAAYPERRIYAVDTLAASLGQGMIAYYAAKKRNEGADIDQVKEYIEEQKLHMCHWFTVDDLNHLKRGGRISSATAAIGTLLDIKPVMHMDDEGHLTAVGKVRGRRASIKKLVNSMEATAIDPAGQTVFISHGDCQKDAEYMAELVRERLGVKDMVINYIGPVIGAHSGPSTVALFFWGTER